MIGVLSYHFSMVHRLLSAAAFLLLPSLVFAQSTSSNPRPRASDLGLRIGILPSGTLNAITDVMGVQVGQITIIRGDNIRTGVTAVLPHSGSRSPTSENYEYQQKQHH